ncbi:MAG: regulator, partial [Bacillota bacterium]
MKKLYFTFLFSVFLLFLNALLLAQWNQTNGPYGGNITVLSAGGNKLAALTSEAGPFLSTDSGQNWNPINNGP